MAKSNKGWAKEVRNTLDFDDLQPGISYKFVGSMNPELVIGKFLRFEIISSLLHAHIKFVKTNGETKEYPLPREEFTAIYELPRVS